MEAAPMKDRIVLITGGTRGFGYAIAEAMLKAGATVIISGRSRSSLKAASARLGAPKALAGLVCDVRKETQVYSLARQVVRRFGRIDVWINNAGYSASAGMILDTPPRHAIDMFLANDMGTLHGCQAALHSMLKRKAGTLVNIYGNGSFLRPASPTALYGATKAWAASLTRSLAQELKGSGVRILGFSPGMLLTDMLTSPTVIGERGRARLKNYSFVLRLLAGSPANAAERLVDVLESNWGEFREYRMLKPWTPLLGLVRIAWENVTHAARPPKYKLKFEPAYKPKI
jgi:NAD(P)-dependent dehydrogenase (short-subunit alcohol dehydrogenase family)